MANKFIICLGIIYSGNGKGISAASIGMLLKARGHSVNLVKCDGYLNSNGGSLVASQHGDVWVTNDGKEGDIDLCHYENICGIETTKDSIFTSGNLYKELIEEHENGVYLGQTIQLQHVTNKVKERFFKASENYDVTIIEIGGVPTDQEVYAYLEAVRQLQQKFRQDVLVVVVAPVLWISTIKEFKTKPLQNGIKEIQKAGIQTDILLARSDRIVPESILMKIADLTNVHRQSIFRAIDVKSVYQVPLEFYNQHLDDFIVDMLRLPRSVCKINTYRDIVEKLVNNDFPEINVGIVYKYENMEESYFNVKEALVHAGVANGINIKIHWINAEELEKIQDISAIFKSIHAIVNPGGFGERGSKGKIKATQYARENKIPFLGICLGLQIAVIEHARNICKLENANSTEFDENTKHPVIDFVEGQKGLVKKSGTMRLGSYDCEIVKSSLTHELYGKNLISERHRHRYEVNPKYLEQYEKNGFNVSGRNPISGLVEIMELDRNIHPYFVSSQFHCEMQSRLQNPAPLFVGLIRSAKERMENE